MEIIAAVISVFFKKSPKGIIYAKPQRISVRFTLPFFQLSFTLGFLFAKSCEKQQIRIESTQNITSLHLASF